jgi:two-component system, cell cycle response regulator
MSRWSCPLPGAFRVLAADGERISSAVVSATLSEAGFGVDVVGDGLAAMEAVTTGGYDILITDWALPRLDGLDLVTAVRERPELQDLYVIFVTARDRKSEVVQGFDAAADDYLTKPFDPRELIARVRSGTRILSLQRELEALNGTLSRLAMTDSLTGLPNRRAVLELLATESARMARGGPPSCVGILDIDSFKRANELQGGHRTGDAVLVEIARTLRAAARTADMVARLGGDEFVLLLHGCTLDESFPVCDRLRAAIESLRVPTVDGEVFTPTVSIGVAPLEPGQAPIDALAAADEALFDAKRTGRNRVAGTRAA